MCNTTNLKLKPLIIEYFENGKISMPGFPADAYKPELQFTIEELKRCRDYIDLIIANPDNFHVVKAKADAMVFKCEMCDNEFVSNDNRKICFTCERKHLINQVKPPFDGDRLLNEIDKITEDFNNEQLDKVYNL